MFYIDTGEECSRLDVDAVECPSNKEEAVLDNTLFARRSVIGLQRAGSQARAT